MYREIHASSLAWPDKTMSVIQQRQLEACEERLRDLPDFGLFMGCTDENAEILWSISYDAEEEARSFSLHSAEGLQKHVLDRMSAEAALLTHAEYGMVLRLILNDGKVWIDDWGDVSPAESLVRRLWCTVKTQDEQDQLCMPKEILMRLMMILQSDAHRKTRDQMLEFSWAVVCALNTCGMIYADDALAYLQRLIPAAGMGQAQRLSVRLMRVAFDYTFTRDGRMVLLHPGMADPERMMHLLRPVRLEDYLLDGDEDISPQFLLSEAEHSATMLLHGLIRDELRPGIHPMMAVEDLRLLAHQAVSFDTMKEVLAAQLMTRPTGKMLDALHLLQGACPDFLFVTARKVH